MGIFVTSKALRKLKQDMDELKDAATELARDMRNLKVDSLENYDKIHRLFGRIAKRAAIDTQIIPAPDLPASDGADGVDEISAKIHARRASGRALGNS